MLAVSVPNLATSLALVETATKCLATALSSPSALTSQRRAVWALVSVSSVVKLFDETITSVSAGARSRSASVMSGPSVLGAEGQGRVPVPEVAARFVAQDRP